MNKHELSPAITTTMHSDNSGFIFPANKRQQPSDNHYISFNKHMCEFRKLRITGHQISGKRTS